MIFGYARVSTKEQKLKRQIDALKEAGCEHIIEEKVSGVDERKKLEELKKKLRVGDTLIVTEFSRLGRSQKDLLDQLSFFKENQVQFVSLKENINTSNSSAMANLLINIMGSVYDFERELMLERQAEGIERAKAAGLYKGRVKKYTDDNKQIQQAKELYQMNKYSVSEICSRVGISRSTFYRNIK